MAPLPYDTNELLKKSGDLLNRVKTEGVTENGVQIYPPQSTTPSISTASLAPQTPLNFQTSQPTPAPIVPTYEPVLTEEEKGAEKQETGLQSMIASLTAETSAPFQTDARLRQEQAQGIAEKKTRLASFQNTQNALQKEAEGINLQLAQQMEQVRNESVGRFGMAAVGSKQRELQTEAQGLLLQNAIKQFQNNASMAAAQGDLSSALEYVDRAIQAEFLPKEKELARAEANLKMLQQSGTLTSAQQKRADARQRQIDAEKEAMAMEKQDKQVIMDTRIKAASLGADPIILKALEVAETGEEAQQILIYSGLLAPSPEKMDTQVVKLDNGNTVLLDTQTGKIIRELGGAKPTKSKVGGSVITTTDGQTVEVSNEAQEWVDAINSGAMSLDDALTKIGSTAASRELKSQIIAGVNAQGGQTATKLEQMKNTVSTIDDILNGDFEYFGASIAPREGWMSKIIGGNPYYEAFKSKVDNLVASLTVDNLALLKGPMSDKDIEFVKQLSSGINMKMSESAARDRLEKIKTRLNEKINNASSTVLKSPDGTQQVNVSDLTPTELQEARDAGWK